MKELLSESRKRRTIFSEENLNNSNRLMANFFYFELRTSYKINRSAAIPSARNQCFSGIFK